MKDLKNKSIAIILSPDYENAVFYFNRTPDRLGWVFEVEDQDESGIWVKREIKGMNIVLKESAADIKLFGIDNIYPVYIPYSAVLSIVLLAEQDTQPLSGLRRGLNLEKTKDSQV